MDRSEGLSSERSSSTIAEESETGPGWGAEERENEEEEEREDEEDGAEEEEEVESMEEAGRRAPLESASILRLFLLVHASVRPILRASLSCCFHMCSSSVVLPVPML